MWLFDLTGKLIYRSVVLAVTHPRTSGVTLAGAGVVGEFGWQPLAWTAAGVLVGTSTWRAAHPDTFNRWLVPPVRTWWRRWWTYRRQWAAVMGRCELTVDYNEQTHLPKLARVSTTPYWDRLTLKMQVGQDMESYRGAAERLRHGFGGRRIVVDELAPGMVAVDMMRRDPLVDAVPAAAMPATTDAIDWRHVPVGIDEFGDPYCISLLGGHTSVAGSIGAGKAGVFWNVVRSIAPAIADGTVRLVGIDPKAKELRQGLDLFAAGDYAVTAEETVELLDRLVLEMGVRNVTDGERGERDFEPSTDRPLTLIDIDELAPLLKYWPRRTRDKIEDALGLLLTQGRASGFIVLGAIQEPTKDVFDVRDLFTRRLALRLPTESHTDAALVESAVEFGAECHRISEGLPGVGFSLQDGAKSTVRFRLGHVRDQDIADLVAYVKSARNVVQLDSRRAASSSPASEAA